MGNHYIQVRGGVEEHSDLKIVEALYYYLISTVTIVTDISIFI